MKICSKCGSPKEDDEFYKDIRHASGLHSLCKVCKRPKKETAKKYKESIKGIVAQMWARCKYRVKTETSYQGIEIKTTSKEFRSWAIPAIEEFIKNNPNDTPSLDRIDPDGHYEINNLRIVDKNYNNLRSRRIINCLKINKESSKEEVFVACFKLLETIFENVEMNMDGFSDFILYPNSSRRL